MQIFISYKWEDRDWYNGLKGLLRNPNNIYQHIVQDEREDLRAKGDNTVRTHLKRIIGSCNAVICLVGQDTHSSEWVQYELEVATSLQEKIIAVRIPNTTGGVPKLIQNRGIPIIEWDARMINNSLL